MDDRSLQRVEDTIGNHSATRIVVTSRLSTLRRADCVIVLDNGRVVEQGSCERLLVDERGALTHLAWGEG